MRRFVGEDNRRLFEVSSGQSGILNIISKRQVNQSGIRN